MNTVGNWVSSAMHAISNLNNVQVLWISIILFSGFVLLEIIAAYVSNSLSLLGDAAAMSVDVFTVSFCIPVILNTLLM